MSSNWKSYSVKGSRRVTAQFLRAIRKAVREGECHKAKVVMEVLQGDPDAKRAPAAVRHRVLGVAYDLVQKCWVK